MRQSANQSGWVARLNKQQQSLATPVLYAIKPGIIALTVLTFAENWNMVEQPLVLLENSLKYPLSIALNSIIEKSSSVAFAGSVIYAIPIVILYFYFEEHISAGISNTDG